MQAVEWYAPRQMRMVDIPKPAPQAHEALVRIESVGVCGSDMHYFLEGRIGDQVLTSPLILGHEYAGIVEAVGAEADPTLVGRRVAVEPGIPCMKCEWCRTGHYNVCRDMFFPGGPGCQGALCEYVCVHADFCFPVPGDMSAPIAALIEPLAVALHTVELAELKVGESAAVVGLGPIGLLVSQVLKLAGADVIYGSDLHAYRAEVAQKTFGVDLAIDASREDLVKRVNAETRNRGVDVAFDCTNRPEGIGIAILCTRPAGRTIVTGISGEVWDPIPVGVARRRELTLKWCRRFRNNYPAAIKLLAEGRLDLTPLITHSYPLERTLEAFELVADTRDGVLKVSIDR